MYRMNFFSPNDTGPVLEHRMPIRNPSTRAANAPLSIARRCAFGRRELAWGGGGDEPG